MDHREPQGLLILPHLRIQNANAISSPLTHGFPSMTAFLGFMWALDRRMAALGIALVPEKIGVVCHWHDEQVQDGYVKTFRLTRNPVSKDGSTAAIVEEGRIHLEVTLIFQVDGGNPKDKSNIIFYGDDLQRRELAWRIRELASTMRIAGGSVLLTPPAPGVRITPNLLAWPEGEVDQDKRFRQIRRDWMPGFALVSRDDLLQRRLGQLRDQDAGATLLDAWLDLSRFNYRSQTDEAGKISWGHDRPQDAGWVVPIPVGYGALSELYEGGQVSNARDSHTLFQFVESLYSMGQWVSPHRLRDLRDLLWWGEYDAQNGLYRCCNGYAPPAGEMGFSALPASAQ